MSFVECSVVGIAAQSPVQNYAYYWNTVNGQGMTQYPEGQWRDVDVSPLVPAETKAVALEGLMLLTRGENPLEVTELRVAFRHPEDPFDHIYHLQALGDRISFRGNVSATVPIKDGRFQAKWWRVSNTSPIHYNCGCSLRLVRYYR